MIDLLTVEKSFIESHVKEGGTVVDFTMGNGHDTLWLSNRVGEKGKVYAFGAADGNDYFVFIICKIKAAKEI